MSKVTGFLKILLIYLGTIFLSLVFSQLGGIIHSAFLKTNCTGGLLIFDFDRLCIMEGFIYFYIFGLAVLAFSILKQKTAWIVYIVGTFIFWLVYIFFIFSEDLDFIRKEYVGSLIIMICMFALGWLLAQGILLVHKKFKKT